MRFHDEKVAFTGDTYIVRKDFIHDQIMAQHLKWDLSFLDGGDDEDEDLPEDTSNNFSAPSNDALAAP